MTTFPNLDNNLSWLESLSGEDQRELLTLFALSSDAGERFAADVFACRPLIEPAEHDPARIEAAARALPGVSPRWDEPLGDSTWGRAAAAAALQRWASGVASAPRGSNAESNAESNARGADATPLAQRKPLEPSPIRARRASQIRGDRIEWLWPGRFAFGRVHVLDGDPGLGKSTIALDIAARLSRGLPMPEPASPPATEEFPKPRRKKRPAPADGELSSHQSSDSPSSHPATEEPAAQPAQKLAPCTTMPKECPAGVEPACPVWKTDASAARPRPCTKTQVWRWKYRRLLTGGGCVSVR